MPILMNVGIFTFMSRINFVLSSVEHEKSFITSRPRSPLFVYGIDTTLVVMGGTLAQIFFKPEKNLEFFRLKICARDAYPGKLE